MSKFLKWYVKEVQGITQTRYDVRDANDDVLFSYWNREKAERRCCEHNAFPLLVEALETCVKEIGFLACCCHSGESLNEKDEHELYERMNAARAALSAAKHQEEKSCPH